MIREIRKKMVVLSNRSPFPHQTKEYINHIERVDWIYMNVRLDGSPLTRQNVESILDGEIVPSGRIMDHIFIERLDKLRKYMYQFEGMRTSISSSLTGRFAGILGGDEERICEYRKSTPTLMEYSYTPILPVEIPEKFERLLNIANRREEFDNPFMKAAQLHNGFLAIYPYGENDLTAARALMEYYLIEQGYPMVPLSLSETEYNMSFIHYLKTGDSTPLAEHLTKAVYDRLELMIQLTAY